MMKMETTGKLDMTQGPILKLIVLFALPMCIGNILQQLYNTVDTLIVGNFCGPISLAAVGTSAQPVELLLCVFLGLGTGVSILVAQHTGRKDFDQVKKVTDTATSFLYVCAIPVSILGTFLGPAILSWMQVPADTFDHAAAYLRIIFWGTLGNLGYNLNAGILRGMGDSKASLLFLFISCVVNVVLDMLFVAVFQMDVSGAALATSIAMFCSWFFSIGYIKKKYPELNFKAFPRKIECSVLKEIVAVGLPLGFNSSLYSIGHLLMQTLINAQGSAFIAAVAIGTKITSTPNMLANALAAAATTFSGQNLGAKNYGRLRTGACRIPLFNGLAAFLIGVALAVLCKPLIGAFTDDAEVIRLAGRYVWVVLPFTSIFVIFNGMVCYVNGIGEIQYPFVVNILMLLAVRIPIGNLIANMGYGTWVMAAVPISFVFALVTMSCYFLTAKWKRICWLADEERSKN